MFIRFRHDHAAVICRQVVITELNVAASSSKVVTQLA
jgi:hypothetical protein